MRAARKRMSRLMKEGNRAFGKMMKRIKRLW